MKILQEGDYRKGDLRSLNMQYDAPLRRPPTLMDRLSRTALKASTMALFSTFMIMLIFSIVGTETNSTLANIGEGIVLLIWFLPDILSIPLIGAMAAGCLAVTALRLEIGNALRNAAALGMSILNASLVMHGMLDLFSLH